MVEGGEEDRGGAVAALVDLFLGLAEAPGQHGAGDAAGALGLGGDAGGEIGGDELGHAAEQAGQQRLLGGEVIEQPALGNAGRFAAASSVSPPTPLARTIASAASSTRVRASAAGVRPGLVPVPGIGPSSLYVPLQARGMSTVQPVQCK